MNTVRKAARPMKMHRFAGVSLAGGKTDKTSVAVIEFFPEHRKLFLRTLREKIRGDNVVSSDAELHRFLTEDEPGLKTIAFDVPLSLPTCVLCTLRCPGYEKCKQAEIKWMWDYHKKRDMVKRPNKIFTPYTERCTEMFVSSELEEPFHPSHALGSNAAPLTARALFVARRLKTPKIEVYPELAIWRIGRSLKLAKHHLRYHKNSIDGDESRLAILRALMDKEIVFIYQQDLKILVDNNHAFEAFICALTAYLKFQDQCQKPPQGFPKNQAWIDFPNEEIAWF